MAKEIAKVACKRIPGGGIIAEIMEGMDRLRDEQDKKRMEGILRVIADQGEKILQVAEENGLENAQQLELLWQVPEIKKELESLSQSIQRIEGLEAFLKRSEEELYEGQKKLVRGQEEVKEMIEKLQVEIEEFRRQHGMRRYAELSDALSILPGEGRVV